MFADALFTVSVHRSPRARGRIVLVLAALLLVVAACAPAPDATDTSSTDATAEAAPAVRDVPTHEIGAFLDNITYFGSSFSPDGSKLLVTSDKSGVYNAYAMPVDGGAPTALTASTGESIFAVGYFPADERFIYQADQGGDENDHVYVQAPDGTVVDLTPGEGIKASFGGWNGDDTRFYVRSNERDRRFFDLYTYDVEPPYAREMFFENTDGYAGMQVSRDGRWVALMRLNNNDDSDIYLYDRELGTTRHLTPHEGFINHSPSGFDPDSRYLYAVTDRDREFSYLVRYDLAAERPETLPSDGSAWETVQTDDWGIMGAGFSRDGKYHYVYINRDARTDVQVFDAKTRERIALPVVEGAEISSMSFARDGSGRIAFYASSSRTPRDLYVQTLGGDEAPRQLTRSLNEAIDANDLVDGEVVRFASYDGLEIPGILYRPHAASPDNQRPALVWVHGGPGGQSRLGYSALIQYLVNHGYVVYAINNRGSSGYGKTFYQADDRKHGNADLGDCVASKQMLIDTGYVDPDRIGIIGGSYGGYMVLAALAFRPDSFDVGVNIFGVSNWVRTLSSIPPYWESARKALEREMGSLDDEEYLRSISPLFHADKIQRPLIVLQGANDPRVLQVESDDIVAAVKKNGVPVEYVVFEDEGHGFEKRENREEGYTAIKDFLDRHLLVAAPANDADSTDAAAAEAAAAS
ncbi:MAG: alpha/beta fold hydrolase [Acidobacteriota bacterium]